MRLEPYALFGFDLATAGKREHLEASAIGEDGAVPAVETVESAGGLDDIHTGTEIEVVGVAKNNLRFHIITQIIDMNGFYRTHRTHWHKDRSLNRAVVGVDDASASRAVGILMLNCKLHSVNNFRQK